MNKTIGKRIRNFREAKGFSQEELAERLKISRSAYQRLENGETNSWINHIESICTSLEVNLDDILKPEEGFVQMNRDSSANESYSNNMVQNQTNNYNLPEKLIEQYEERLKQKDEEIKFLKSLIEKK
ncbi:helix-turn-helix domain-containing protein [Chryseobacterium carnipullorum]|uniref:helix-turn-helix domain-containing protein n=1 Tax=Chryseobacterium carnipullorum TaxID=1124835 RepID=UPI000E7F9E49|nr:helix-turn-helix transcriptional regulator [Chryseobacterium carnipullorum]HBV13803.1 XRE family transcriptional regulator [Chryseobacterium carnipullorum]